MMKNKNIILLGAMLAFALQIFWPAIHCFFDYYAGYVNNPVLLVVAVLLWLLVVFLPSSIFLLIVAFYVLLSIWKRSMAIIGCRFYLFVIILFINILGGIFAFHGPRPDGYDYFNKGFKKRLENTDFSFIFEMLKEYEKEIYPSDKMYDIDPNDLPESILGRHKPINISIYKNNNCPIFYIRWRACEQAYGYVISPYSSDNYFVETFDGVETYLEEVQKGVYWFTY